MNPTNPFEEGHPPAPRRAALWPWLTWLTGWALMLVLDPHLDLANLAMVLMLTSAIASLWWPG